ncbi:MAG: putative sugar nucleotidyl transferase [Longimicrobiales bacterium]
MSERPALVLFDDDVARRWRPLATTRPVGELRFGGLTLRERCERVFDLRCVGHLAPGLEGFDEEDAPHVLERPPAGDAGVLYVSSRYVPAWAARFDPAAAAPVFFVAGEPVACWAPPGAEPPEDRFFRAPAANAPSPSGPELPGAVLEHVWELIARSPEQIGRDVAALFPGASMPPLPDGVHGIGSAAIVLGAGVTIEPGVVIDVRRGPVRIEDDVAIRAFTRLEGPAWIARGCTLLGGPFTAVSVGPVCKVHGEMEETLVLGYSNKAHDGFLGHAYVGRWVNLGALTTNSDLKNNYGRIRISTADGDVDTGLTKLGCLLGDHVKTVIGTLLNTGTVIEAGSNVFGESAPAKYVAPFSWGDAPAGYDIDKFLETARVVAERRERSLTPGVERVLRELYDAARRQVESGA